MVFLARRVDAERATPADPGFEPLTRGETRFADWTPRTLSPHEENVEVYSNCEQVELLLNGTSLGAKPRPADDAPRTWRVLFVPGKIEAIGRNNGKVAATQEFRTAGKAAKLQLSVNRERLTAEWDDVAYVTASVVNTNGVLVPDANGLIRFRITGPGVIAAVDNGDNASHELFQASERHAYQGRSIAIIRASAAGSRITISAMADGLKGSAVSVETGSKP